MKRYGVEYDPQDPMSAFKEHTEAQRRSHGKWQRSVVRVNNDLWARSCTFTEEEDAAIHEAAYGEPDMEEHYQSNAFKKYSRRCNKSSGVTESSYRFRPRQVKGRGRQPEKKNTEMETPETKETETEKAETETTEMEKTETEKPKPKNWKPRKLRRRR